MKLFFLKISALIVIVVGVALIGQFVKCPYVCSYVGKMTDGSLDAIFPGSFQLLAGIALVLIGVYSALPSFKKKQPVVRTIKQNLENGIAEINLATVEKECEAMLKKVAPLKQVSVTLTPSKDQKKVQAEISPVIILKEGENLPDIQELIIHRIEEFLSTYFGLSISLPVSIKLDNFQLDGEKIYASLGKTAFDAFSQKYETEGVEKEGVSTESAEPSSKAITQPSEEVKNATDDYLTCKMQEPEQKIELSIPPLEESSEQSDQSDKSDNNEIPRY